MNKHTRKKDLMIPEVTTGPIAGSAKVYTAPEGHADVRRIFPLQNKQQGVDESIQRRSIHALRVADGILDQREMRAIEQRASFGEG